MALTAPLAGGANGGGAVAGADPDRRDAGDAGLHGARAVPGAPDRRQDRSVQLLRRALRGALSAAALQWDDFRSARPTSSARAPCASRRPARDIPAGIREAVLRGLSVDPNDRWPTMKSLLAELENDRLVAGRDRFVAGAAAKLADVWEAAVARVRPGDTPARRDMRHPSWPAERTTRPPRSRQSAACSMTTPVPGPTCTSTLARPLISAANSPPRSWT